MFIVYLFIVYLSIFACFFFNRNGMVYYNYVFSEKIEVWVPPLGMYHYMNGLMIEYCPI